MNGLLRILLLGICLSLAACSRYRLDRATAQCDPVLDRAREAGYPTRLVVDLTRKPSDAAASARRRDPVSTLLVLSGGDVLVDPGVRLRSWTPELAERLRREWVAPFLEVNDVEGATRSLSRGFVELLGERENVRFKAPLPPILGPRGERGKAPSDILWWGAPLVLVVLGISVWLHRREPRRLETRLAFSQAVQGLLVGRPHEPSFEDRLPRPGLLLLLVLVLVAGLYSTSLSVPFLWDDRRLILEEIIEAPRPLLDYVVTPFWRSGETGLAYRGFFRPLTTLSYVFDAAWSGGNPVGFHLTNLVLHLGVVTTLYFLARRFGSRPLPALFATAAFGLAPRLTESVTWISGRTDVLATLLGMLALYWYPLRCCEKQASVRAGRVWLSSLLLALGLFAKEIAFAFMAVIVVDEIAYQRRASRSIADGFRRLYPLFVGLLAYAVLRVIGLAGTTSETINYGGSRVFACLEAIGRYAIMLVDFARPRTQIGFLPMRSWTIVALGAVLALVLTNALRRGTRRVLAPRADDAPFEPLSLALLLLILGLAPVLHIVSLSVNVVAADRFLYVPLIGLTLAGALSWSRLGHRADVRLSLAALLICALSMAGTLTRNRDYQSELAFWGDALKTTRVENTLPLNELANVYYRAQEHELALQLYMRLAREMRKIDLPESERAKSLSNMANALSGAGRYDEALRVALHLIDSKRPVPKDLYNIGLIHLHRLDFQRARMFCNAALKLYPDYSGPRAMLETIDSLEREYRAFVSKAHGESKLEVARFLARAGARAEAQRAYLEVLTEMDDQAREEALGYLVTFGDRAGVKLALGRYATSNAALNAAAQDRMALAREVEATRHLVEPYLARYDADELGL